MTNARSSSDDRAVATSLARDVRIDDWIEPSEMTPEAMPPRAEWLWPLFGLVLLGAFLLLVVDDYPLRTLIAAN